MGALFVRSRRGRGGTRKQLGSHSKEFKERCSRGRRGGAGPAEGGGAGVSAGGADTREGAVSWPPWGPGERRLGPQDGVSLVGRAESKRWQATLPAGAVALAPE